MKIKLLLTLIILAAAVSFLSAHEDGIPVIVDCDGSLDDLRAIILLLQNDNYDIEALVTSDGGSSPRLGAEGLNAVLWKLGRESVLLGYGTDSDQPAPPWRGFTEVLWQSLVDPQSTQDFPSADIVLTSAIDHSEDEITYICLGPMTNLAQLLKNDNSAIDKISKIYYRGRPPAQDGSSWNTDRDTAAVSGVMQSGIPIYFFNPDPADELSFDTILYNRISSIRTPAAELITTVHSQNPINQILQSGHFGAWDESLILSIMYPALAEYAQPDSTHNFYFCTDFDPQSAFNLYLELLNRGGITSTQSRPTVIYREFPADNTLYKNDVALIAAEVIERHGREEWDAAVLTSELHRHLGIYSIIGVKMGIHARELLHASLDQVQVVSYAGSEPPISCFNDGLQTATGATLGHGTITIDNSDPRLEVLFSSAQDTIRLRLKTDVGERVKNAISDTVQKHGGLNQAYFDDIRQLALDFWKELDRADIFEVMHK